MRCVEIGKVRRVLDETPSSDPATGGRGPDSPLATRHSPLFRRGVTLVEMLVTLAVLLLMMTAIVRIFQAATGALNAAQVYQELDNQLRLLDSTLRSDLNGVTCKLTPPNDPKNNQGYLEYGENEFADVQGEDSDDYIRFTAKAPAGRPFTGRMWYRRGSNQPRSPQPITITSEYAEIIYFLRNGNLYRRVLLVAPERQSTIVPTVDNIYLGSNTGFNPAALGGTPASPPAGLGIVSWQGVNDLSAHPAPQGTVAQNNNNSVVLNTLANLTNRENRAFYQRFGNDFEDLQRNQKPDGLVDDFNQDNVPDYYPTLYPGVFSPASSNGGSQLVFEAPFPGTPRPFPPFDSPCRRSPMSFPEPIRFHRCSAAERRTLPLTAGSTRRIRRFTIPPPPRMSPLTRMP